jgi:tRNA uridine 5-carboxymethylaminomethyl modification enzyme
VEAKFVRFQDKPDHQIVLEPEDEGETELYVNGLSTSMPADVQCELVRSLPGCEEAEIQRFGYAVEYDFAPPHQIRSDFETRAVAGLFFAGQINGTSGYEEAAGQGLLAGINAALKLRQEPPLILGRHEAYLGVMADDLATKEITEPYRLFTSRAEYRLLLRQDNADRRLLPHAQRLGLLLPTELDAAIAKEAVIARTVEKLKSHRPPRDAATYWEWLRRPETTAAELAARGAAELSGLPTDVLEALKIEAKYEGYLARQSREVERMRELEEKVLAEDFDYERVPGMSREAVEKMTKIRPRTLGQASRLAGVTPADLALLTVFFTRH